MQRRCDHTLKHCGDGLRSTVLVGSWVRRRDRYGVRIECGVCGKLYGRQRKSRASMVLDAARDRADWWEGNYGI